jgi:hypothetical protein
MVFRLPWSSGRFSARKPALQQHQQSNRETVCDTKFKALNFQEQDANPEVQLKEATTKRLLDQEMTAREKAQTFVAMSGFPMPFLP